MAELNFSQFSSIAVGLEYWAEKCPDEAALIFLNGAGGEEKIVTRQQIAMDFSRAGMIVSQLGGMPGQVVLLAMSHGYELVAAFLGSLQAGLIPVVLPYPRSGQKQAALSRIQTLAVQINSSFILAEDSIVDLASEQSNYTQTIHKFHLDQTDAPLQGTPPFIRRGEDLLYLQMTSGTTGEPKLAALSQGAVLKDIHNLAEGVFLPDDLLVSWMPYHHDFGLVASLLMPILSGLTVVTFSPADWITNPDLLFEAIHRYQATVTCLPNFALAYMAQRVSVNDSNQYNLKNLRAILVAAELVTYASVERFVRQFAPWGIQPAMIKGGWGMSEQVLVVTAVPVDESLHLEWLDYQAMKLGRADQTNNPDPISARPVYSVGRLLPGVQIRILGQNDNVLADRQIGEVVIHTQHSFSGYYLRPDLTRSVLQSGWYRTGDLGYLAGDELFIIGRKDDLMIIAGENIQPQAIEEIAVAVLGKKGRIAVAFGVLDESIGTQSPVLVCEVRNQENEENLGILRQEIQSRVQAQFNFRLADIRFVPKGWVIQSDAKVGRSANREKYVCMGWRPGTQEGGTGSSQPVDQEQLEQKVAQIFAKILDLSAVNPDDDFFALGGDSLSALRLVIEVESITSTPVTEDFFRKPTLRNLIKQSISTQFIEEKKTLRHQPDEILRESNNLNGPKNTNQKKTKYHLNKLPHRLRIHFRTLFERFASTRSYFEGVEMLMDWFAKNWVQERLYPEECSLIFRLAQSMGTPHEKILPETQLSLVSHSIMLAPKHGRKTARASALVEGLLADVRRNLSDDEIWTKHFEVISENELQQAIKRGQGVICVGPHTTTRFALNLYFERNNQQPLEIGDPVYRRVWNKYLAEDTGDFSAGEKVSRAISALSGYRVLTEGGSVLMASDQEDALHGKQVVIGDRRHRIVPGFAELAVNTGAEILPVLTQLNVDGRIRLNFFPSIRWNRQQDHEGQISEILTQYGLLQTQLWMDSPGALLQSTIKTHLARPVV